MKEFENNECFLKFTFGNGFPVDIPLPYDYVIAPHTTSDNKLVYIVIRLSTVLKNESSVVSIFSDRASAESACSVLRNTLNLHIESEVITNGK